MESKKRILIIDDDPRNIFALELTLKVKGYQPVSSQSARDGIALLQSEQDIGMVLMDMMMPDMDGYQAIKLLKGDPRFSDLPIVAVTAQAMIGDREKCLQAGADEYIAKPIDLQKLLDVIKTLF